jgi:hypothetical protein
VEGIEAAAALGVRPCLDSAGVFELAMDLHNNQRKKSLTLMVGDERDAYDNDNGEGEGEKTA